MRLSEWQAVAPHQASLSAKVMDVIGPVLKAFGAPPDPSSWIIWGDDPASRFVIFIPSAAGMIQLHIRVNVPQEGPRAAAKLVRWNRVQLGELALEMAAGHRLMSFQVENQVLRGSDAQADAIAAFALELFAGVDGRPWVSDRPDRPAAAAPAASPGSGAAGSTSKRSTGAKSTGTPTGRASEDAPQPAAERVFEMPPPKAST